MDVEGSEFPEKAEPEIWKDHGHPLARNTNTGDHVSQWYIFTVFGHWTVRFGLFQWLALLFGFPGGSDGKESTWNAGGLSSSPALGRSPGGGHDNPLQYPCLENSHGALWTTVHGVTKSYGYDWVMKHSIALINRSNSKMLTVRIILVVSSFRGDMSEICLKSYY